MMGTFKSFDGTEIYYEVHGSGKPLLFLYGLVCSHLHWRYQIEYFKKTHQVVWADYRGHHKTGMPLDSNNITIEALGRDFEMLLEKLELKEVTLIGHSVGVTVALEIYRRKPKKVKALILSNGTSRLPLESLLKTNLPQTIHPLLYSLYRRAPKLMNRLWRLQGENKLIHWLIGHLGFNPSLAKTEDIADYIRNFSKLDMLVFLQLLKSYEEYDATPWLHQISVPTLLIAGENDVITPRENQEVMAQLIPGAKLELIRNGSHCPQLDIPDFINAVIEGFHAGMRDLSPLEFQSLRV